MFVYKKETSIKYPLLTDVRDSNDFMDQKGRKCRTSRP